MARRVSRPLALRITRVIAPCGVSANVATLAAWACGAASAATLGWGTVWGWAFGAAMLQIWYLLDHVDGQLARWRGTSSLDGVQLDYLMHHSVNLLVPFGVGWGLFVQTLQPLWAIGGLVWGLSTLLITLHHDARYKAFIQRLKRVRGRLEVVGGGGAQPAPQPPIPRRPSNLLAWAARKACEMHVVMNAVTAIALAQLFANDERLVIGGAYLATIAPVAGLVAAWTIVRSQYSGAAEQEFAAWYRVPPRHELVFDGGWWNVVPSAGSESGDFGETSSENG